MIGTGRAEEPMASRIGHADVRDRSTEERLFAEFFFEMEEVTRAEGIDIVSDVGEAGVEIAVGGLDDAVFEGEPDSDADEEES